MELEILKGELQEAKTLLEQKVHLLTDSPAKENKKDSEEASFRAEVSNLLYWRLLNFLSAKIKDE